MFIETNQVHHLAVAVYILKLAIAVTDNNILGSENRFYEIGGESGHVF